VSAGELVWFLFLPSFAFQSSWPLDKSLSDLAGLVLEYVCSVANADATETETEAAATTTSKSTTTSASPAMKLQPMRA
jgi:hypothetical protein